MGKFYAYLRRLGLTFSASIKEWACLNSCIMYIYQQKNWPNFTWDYSRLQNVLNDVSFARGVLLGRMNSIGFKLKSEATLNSLSQEIVKSSEIEGEILNTEQVRSSIARRLNLEFKSSAKESHYIDGIVDMMLDATNGYMKPLTKKRLFAWHASLFPTGFSGMYKIDVGKFRLDKDGRMQVISYRRNKEIVHFQAPEAFEIPKHISAFIKWFNKASNDVISAAIAHLWFVTIHPFDDGNGRITRALTEMMLAKVDSSGSRFYSMSNQVLLRRKEYYDILEKTQSGSLDITDWILWFCQTLLNAVNDSLKHTDSIFQKAKFWQNNGDIDFSANQQKITNRLFDGFDGNLTSSKWAKICKCSQDTAIREISNLLKKNILKKVGEGRSTHYVLVLNNVND